MTFEGKNLYKTGEVCVVPSNYRFVKHTDGTVGCHPTWEEYTIPLGYGDRFPPLRHCGKGAYWKLV